MQAYSDPKRETAPHALPDLEIFQLTAAEVVEQDPGMEDVIYEFSKRPEFRLASMNSKAREKMIDAIIKSEGIKGGWFYQYCFPGCLPDGGINGPFATAKDAVNAAQDDAAEGEE